MSYLLPGSKILYVHNQHNQVTATANIEISAIGTGQGIGSLMIPANFWAAGKRLQMNTKGTYQTPATPGNVTVKIKLGSTVVAQILVTASILATSSTVRELYGEAVISCQSVSGGVAKLNCDGFMSFEIAAGVTVVPFSTNASVSAGYITASTSTVVPKATVDYTIANAGLLDISETWSTTSTAQGTTISNGRLTDESIS